MFINDSMAFIKARYLDITLIFLFLIIAMIFVVKGYGFQDMSETMENMDETDKKTLEKTTQDFCETLKGDSEAIEKKCLEQSEDGCKVRSCCILAFNKQNTKGQCLAGSRTGPTYHTDENGQNKNVDYYYYRNKCYGNDCPQE